MSRTLIGGRSGLTGLVDECLCLHAEENALLEAGRERIGEDSVIYCNTYVASCNDLDALRPG